MHENLYKKKKKKSVNKPKKRRKSPEIKKKQLFDGLNWKNVERVELTDMKMYVFHCVLPL